MRNQVTDYFIYRWRYVLGYLFIALSVTAVIAIASIYVPGALREGEIASSLQSGSLAVESLDPKMAVNLPYHVLQRLSFMLFGVSTLSIKLPSIVLGTLTVIGLFLLIRTWFRRNIAIITTVIAATSAQFLFLLQDGTPSITFSFLTVWLLFAATYVTRRKMFGTLWKVLTGILMASALYVPLGIYLVIAILTTAVFHPHIRHLINHFSRPRLWIGVVLGSLSAAPAIYASILDRNVLYSLVGFPTQPLHMVDNLKTLALDLFGFASQSDTCMMRPLYSLSLLLLIGVGIYKLLTYKYTARSYATLTLGLVLVPLIILNPQHVTHLFPLACLMIAMGIATLITNWYKLFPRNPYARVAGLIPLSILVLGIIYGGVTRYMDDYSYSPNILSHYSNDLRLMQREVSRANATKQPVQFVPSVDELPFYALVAHYNKDFTVTPGSAATLPPAKGEIIYSHAGYAAYHPQAEIATIVTNRMANASDRFYIYKSQAK